MSVMHWAFCLLLAGSLVAQDSRPEPTMVGWHRFRGPNGSGFVEDLRLPQGFDEQLWRTTVPSGFSSPVVGENLVFVSAHEDVELVTIAIGRADGVERWRRVGPRQLALAQGDVGNNPVSGTPVTDGRTVFVFYSNYGLVAYSAEGSVLWEQEIASLAAPSELGTSPILAGNQLLLQVDQNSGSFLLSLEKGSGEELWRTPREGITQGFSTPVLRCDHARCSEVIVASSHRLAGFDLLSGKALWELPGLAWQVKASPVIGGDRLYATWNAPDLGGFGIRPDLEGYAELLATYDVDDDQVLQKSEFVEHPLATLWSGLDLDADGNLDEKEWQIIQRRGRSERGIEVHSLPKSTAAEPAKALWRHERSAPEFTTPLLYQGRLYTIRDGGILHVLDAESGELLSNERVPGSTGAFFASPIAGDGMILLADHAGVLSLLRAGDRPSLIAQHELSEPVIATPALIAGAIIVRSYRALYCFGTRKSG